MRWGGAGRWSGRRGRSAVGLLVAVGVGVLGALAVGGTGQSAGLVPPGTKLRPAAITTVPGQTSTTTTTTTTPAAPTTTVPSPPTTAPPPPTTAPPPPTTAPPPPAPALRGILPPDEPPADIGPSPDFLTSCQGNQYDDSTGCVLSTVSAIDNARAQEGLPPMGLPSNWYQLSVTQQLFVATDLERTVRGLPALTAMVGALDQAAAQGAAADTDPTDPAGFPYTQWGSNWAGAVGNPLEAVYFWMYDDGLGSGNVDCTSANQSGCWGHRQNVLMHMSCQMCVMGTGYDGTAWKGGPSMAEILVDSSGQPAVDFTWQQEQPYL